MNAQPNRRKYIFPAIVIAILLTTVILIGVQIGRAQAAPYRPQRPTPAAMTSATPTRYTRYIRPTRTTRYVRPAYPTRRPTPQRGG